MTGSEREQLRSELDANARLRMDVARLEDALLLARNEARRQKGRAEYWREVAKRARAQADEERRERLFQKRLHREKAIA